MEQLQLDFFEELTLKESTSERENPKNKEKMINIVKDIRTEQQNNKKVAYDVGQKIGGSRKDQAALRKLFEEKPTVENLQEVEETSPILAEEVVKKSTLISPFDYQKEYEAGVDVEIAELKKLLIQRIDTKPSQNTVMGRQQYVEAVTRYVALISPIKTWDEMNKSVYAITKKLRAEREGLETAKRYVEYAKKRLTEPIYDYEIKKYGSEEAVMTKRRERVQEQEDYVQFVLECLESPLSPCGAGIVNFYLKSKSREGTLKTIIYKELKWKDVLQQGDKKTTKARKKGFVWKRQLPEHPMRNGWRRTEVRRPEDFVKVFGFRGAEFGHYVNDDRGLEHLIQSAEAFHDLADLLGVTDKQLSLQGRLAMAFGARGKGRALGHYEPLNRVINLTRDKGSLGIQAHEWWHSLSHFLYEFSHGFIINGVGYASEPERLGSKVSDDLKQALKNVLDVMKSGVSTQYLENNNQPGVTWSLSPIFKKFYSDANGDIRRTMEAISSYLKRFYTKETIYKRKLKRYANAMAWYHKQQTGEHLNAIPVPSTLSQYYTNAIELDKGKRGKYWSSDEELFARAFECYVADEMYKAGKRNDYLVAGNRVENDLAFPMTEERGRINKAMKDVIQFILKEVL